MIEVKAYLSENGQVYKTAEEARDWDLRWWASNIKLRFLHGTDNEACYKVENCPGNKFDLVIKLLQDGILVRNQPSAIVTRWLPDDQRALIERYEQWLAGEATKQGRTPRAVHDRLRAIQKKLLKESGEHYNPCGGLNMEKTVSL